MGYWAERLKPQLPADILARIPADVPAWEVGYWQLQYLLTRDHLLPLLRQHDALPSQGRVLEVGPAHAGCLAALHEATGLPAHGLELDSSRVETAAAINEILTPGNLDVRIGDITDAGSLESLEAPFSLILLRDVIEHIENRATALANCYDLLEPGGHLLLTFPPYYSPFGAHQQILTPAWLRLPWLQLLPQFLSLVGRGELNEAKKSEMEELRRCSLTISKFEAAISSLPFEVVSHNHFLLRPIFRYRYGLPILSAQALSSVPILRELLITGAWYLLKRPR